MHLIIIAEFAFFCWLFGITEALDADPNHLIFKLILLSLCFVVSEWSIKKSGVDEVFEEEIKKLTKK